MDIKCSTNFANFQTYKNISILGLITKIEIFESGSL